MKREGDTYNFVRLELSGAYKDETIERTDYIEKNSWGEYEHNHYKNS